MGNFLQNNSKFYKKKHAEENSKSYKKKAWEEIKNLPTKKMDNWIQEHQSKGKFVLLKVKPVISEEENQIFYKYKQKSCNFELKICYDPKDATIYTKDKHDHEVNYEDLSKNFGTLKLKVHSIFWKKWNHS